MGFSRTRHRESAGGESNHRCFIVRLLQSPALATRLPTVNYYFKYALCSLPTFYRGSPHINFPKRRKSESYTNENTQSKAPGAGIEPTKHVAAFAQAFYIAFPTKLSRRIPTQSIVQVHHVSIDRVVIHRRLKLASTQHPKTGYFYTSLLVAVTHDFFHLAPELTPTEGFEPPNRSTRLTA